MAYRINKEIIHGWIDNRVRGKVIGEIYLQGESDPICLELEGDCHRDLAGSRCEFKNPSPELNKGSTLNLHQIGKVGDMTASRRCRIPDIPFMEYYEQKKKGLNPKCHLSNVLYLEWFSEKNGRVVIELPDIDIDVSLPKWKMTPEEEESQQKSNMDNMISFLDSIVESTSPTITSDFDGEMDEFEWEQFLKDSDAKSAKFGELLEKYMDNPDCNEIIDEQMGWNMAEAFANTEYFEDEELFEDEEPNDCGERKEHPLIKRIGNLWLSLHRHVEKTSYHNSEDPVGLLIGDLIFNIQFANAKAGSVLIDGDFYENGMIIAKLKRAMTGIHKALNLASNKDVIKALPKIIEATQAELFVIREEILKIMNKLR